MSFRSAYSDEYVAPTTEQLKSEIPSAKHLIIHTPLSNFLPLLSVATIEVRDDKSLGTRLIAH